MNLYFSKTLKISAVDGFHLLQDHMSSNHDNPWNDYDYIVKFELYFVKGGVKQSLGYTRLLVNGHIDTSKYFIQEGVKEEKNIYHITGVFDAANAVSLPLEIDFYHRLNKKFSTQQIESLLSTLCDASFFYNNFNTYKSWDGFSGSVMREGTAAEAILRKGHQIAIGRYSPKESFSINLDLSSAVIDPVEFFFDNRRDIGKTNINLLVGKNGVGKTELLKNLCRVVTGLKRIDEKWPYFHKLIVVAYSPFENFYTKDALLKRLDKKYAKKKQTKTKKVTARRRLNVNEYAYVGFRRESGEFDLDWPDYHSVESIIKILQFDRENDWWVDKSRFEILKETLSLCIDFDSIEVNCAEDDEIVLVDCSKRRNKKIIASNACKKDGLVFIKDGERIPLSSGQKIYSYMIPALVAEIEDESLIILDEPELYLHPHLEVGLINMMKHLLAETSSYAIIATHSAIITREVERRGIKILRRKEEKTIVVKPGFETYGESLEAIIGEVFDDYITPKPFQSAIDQFIENDADMDTLLADIGAEVGDEALAYIAAKVAADGDFIIEEE